MNKNILIICLYLLSSGCIKSSNDHITCLQITHRDGLEETISGTSELSKYVDTDFSKPQNFQKVVQYRKKQNKRVSSIMTYHENGSLEALLETKNARANGRYLQFHDNGAPFIQAFVIEGRADLSDEAKRSFVFDGDVKVFDAKQNCISQMHYNRGKLEGSCIEYWPNGAVKSETSYQDGQIDGLISHFDENNLLLGQENYSRGLRDGISFKKNHFHETYEKDLLMQASYFDRDQNICFSVKNGTGKKPIYQNNQLHKIIEIQGGKKNGMVKCFSPKGYLINQYTMLDGKKEGLEECFFDEKETKIQLQIPWQGDEIHGMVKTYYPNQKMQSQTEMIKSKKTGLSIAYYENASLMLMEEYKNNKLINGKYYRINENTCTSSVENGQGLASIFDKNGNFLRTLEYKDHKIQIQEDEQ